MKQSIFDVELAELKKILLICMLPINETQRDNGRAFLLFVKKKNKPTSSPLLPFI